VPIVRRAALFVRCLVLFVQIIFLCRPCDCLAHLRKVFDGEQLSALLDDSNAG
jgi:hypothetical protein